MFLSRKRGKLINKLYFSNLCNKYYSLTTDLSVGPDFFY